jgi:ZIP family zinc transporter
MLGAFGWGTLAASSLVIGAIVALLFRIGLRTIGLIMAFGAGVLISAVSFDLVEEAFGMSLGHGWVIAGIFAGCAVFFGGDWLIDRSGGSERKDAKGGQQSGSSLAIVLGSVLDGIPESMVIGLTIFQGGGVGAAYLIAVFISNLPESISSTSGLVERLEEGTGPLDVDRDRDRLGACVARRLRTVPAFVSRRRRFRARVRGRSDPHHAREHDDARGI